jgi:hypothetical protein
MSAYTKVKCIFKDPELLVEALTEIGYKPKVYPGLGTHLIDYHGSMRPQMAQIVIPRQQLSPSANDVGFAKQLDGTYTAIISEYDSGATFTPVKMEQLKLAYNMAKAKKIAATQGMKLVGQKESTLKNGKRNVQYVFEPR